MEFQIGLFKKLVPNGTSHLTNWGSHFFPDVGTNPNQMFLSGLVHGKNIIEYAISVFGARLGLEFKEKGIPIAGGKMRSGYTNSYSQLDRDLHDCGADGIKVTLTKQNVHRFHGRFYIDETSGKRELKKIDLDDTNFLTLSIKLPRIKGAIL